MSAFLKHVYSEIAENYERVNHIFSFGLDIFWRKQLAKLVVDSGARGVLDVCTGTGETARYIKKFSEGSVHIIGADFSEEMLSEAKKHAGDIEYRQADTSNLPFVDGFFDAVTTSFAARNLNSGDKPLVKYFKEIRRVLKKGGVFYNLETSQPSNRLVLAFFRLYVKLLVALIGRKFSGNEEGYKYLASSILAFMEPDELAEKLKEAGFLKVGYKKLCFGTAAIHHGMK